MKIVCLDAYTIFPATDPRWQDFATLGSSKIYDRTAPSEIVERCTDADVVLTNKVPLTADVIAALPKLRYIGILATGYNIVDIEAAAKAGIVVTNIPSYSTESVAQQAFALLLAITNRVESYTRCNDEGHWSSCADFSYRIGPWPELAGKTIGIVGFGHIGAKVAEIARAFGMKVAAFTSKSAEELPSGTVKMELDELFSKADVVSLHCPLLPDTQQMVDAHRLALMQPHAILINTARGQLVDEASLADALAGHRIFAAGLDVMAQEPPAHDNPLLHLPNCFITPHIGWASTEARSRLVDIALANLRAFADGHPQNVVG